MFKRLLLAFSIAGAAVCSSQSRATPFASFDYVGTYQLTDADADGFRERIRFLSSAPFLPGPHIALTNPAGDPLLGFGGSVGAGYLSIVDMFLDTSGNLVLTADIAPMELEHVGSTGQINTSFSVNLTNFIIDASYMAGSSPVVDIFQSVGQGGVNYTLNFSGDMYLAIAGSTGTGVAQGSTVSGSFSGTAATIPEPASLALFGLGLLVAGAASRQRKPV
jgi:hypothetical protein